MKPVGDYLLGIDIGTTATKALLLHSDLGIVAEASSPANLVSPAAGWAEEDPDEWWANVGIVCRSCLAQANVPASGVAAVGVSGMVPALILLDSGGQVIRPSIQQNDARAFDEIAHFRSQVDEADVLRRTGSAVTQQSIGPKLLWLRRHMPADMARADPRIGFLRLHRFPADRSGELRAQLGAGERAV